MVNVVLFYLKIIIILVEIHFFLKNHFKNLGQNKLDLKLDVKNGISN